MHRHLAGQVASVGARLASTSGVVKTGIVMTNMGGPKDLDEVGSFLYNLFTDTDLIQMPFQKFLAPIIAKRRTPSIRELYSEIGGKSPIYEYTEKQGEAMCAVLDKVSPSTAPHKHYTAFRYVEPRAETALERMKADGVERAVLFSQYPQWSCTTSGSSSNELFRLCREKEAMETAFQWSIIDRWPTHPMFIRSLANNVQKGLDMFPDDESRADARILFSAHSLPLKTVYKGDHYPAEVAATAYRVMEELGFSHRYNVCWQSQVGRIPWLGPQTDQILKDLQNLKEKNVLVVPIAFTSDHIETLAEIDIEFAEVAHKAGIENFFRAPSLNDNEDFTEAQAHIVKEHLEHVALTGQCHSLQYTSKCPTCVNPNCRSIVNPAQRKA